MEPDIGQWSTEKMHSLIHDPSYNKSLVILSLTEINLYQRWGKQNESCKLRMKYTLHGQLYKKSKSFPFHSMNANKGAQVQFHIFLTLALDGGEWLTSCPSYFNQGNKSGPTE
jgi:hypothetical protein